MTSNPVDNTISLSRKPCSADKKVTMDYYRLVIYSNLYKKTANSNSKILSVNVVNGVSHSHKTVIIFLHITLPEL